MDQLAPTAACSDCHAQLMPPQVPPERGHPLAQRASGSDDRPRESARDRYKTLSQQPAERFVESPNAHADADPAQFSVRDVERDTAPAHGPPLPAREARPATVTTAPASQKKM